jgi:hypothetical protein
LHQQNKDGTRAASRSRESRKQRTKKKERDESSSFLDDERVFSNNTDKSKVAPIKVDDVSPNKLSSKMK